MKLRSGRAAIAASALAVWALAAPVSAHHSYAMFDRSKTLALSGQVKEFDMITPHGWLIIVAADPQGQARTWSFEMGPPGSLSRQGWTAQSVQAGDHVDVRFHPVKDGSYGGQLVSVRLPDGRTLIGGPPVGSSGRGGVGGFDEP